MKKTTLLLLVGIMYATNSSAQPIGSINTPSWCVIGIIGGVIAWGSWYVIPLMVQAFVSQMKK